MATITITATRTGQTIPSRTVNVADTDLDAVVAAYQNDANSFVGGTATYAQVLSFMVTQWVNQTRQRVQQSQTVPAVIPVQINMA